jgi:hypothetical protein
VFRAAGGSVAQLDLDGAVVRERRQVPLRCGPGNANPFRDLRGGILFAGEQGFQDCSLGGGPRFSSRSDVAGNQGTLGPLNGGLVDGGQLSQDPAIAGLGPKLLR